jgi:hypothetical protein
VFRWNKHNIKFKWIHILNKCMTLLLLNKSTLEDNKNLRTVTSPSSSCSMLKSISQLWLLYNWLDITSDCQKTL